MAQDGGTATRRRNPWWIPPFLGRVPPDLEDRHVALTGAVALALLFEEYDIAMLTSALKYIALELGMAEESLPDYLGVIRLGALPAFLVIPFADRIGRRRVFLLSVIAMGILTFLTAFCRTPLEFTVLQLLTRTFFVTGSAVAFVIVTEEFPAHRRGWGIGMVGALGATGHGIAALVFSQIERLPYGWRALYVVGIAPVFLLPLLRRRVTETTRFTREQAARDAHVARHGPAPRDALAWLTPLRSLARTHPARAAGIAAASFLPALGLACAFQFTGYYTLQVLGWTPGQYSAMVIIGGAVGIIGNVVAGRLGDRIGRRYVGAGLLGVFPLFVTAFYLGPAWLVPASWIGFLFASQGGRVMLRALATELFPTNHRGAASGLYSVLETTGQAAGLFVLGIATAASGDLIGMIPWTCLGAGAGGLVILLLPETRGRELEAIST